MSSKNVALLGAQVPRVEVVPPAKWTDGEDAGFLADGYGLTPDEWQQRVLDAWLGRRRDGKWAASTAGCAVPRQNGKNGVLEIVELFFTVSLGLKILHTAHEVKTARKAFIRLCSFFENERQYPELAALVKDIRRTNGQEAIVLTNGGSVEFIARSKGSGRGFTVDVLVCDEAQELSDDALEALTPTTSAAPSGDPLAIFTGTPPSASMNGEVWTRIRQGALDGTDRRIAWLEWSVTGDANLDDRELWAATNPALGTRLNIETLEAERSRFSAAGFARERLGMWASDEALSIIPASVWANLVADNPPAENVAPDALAVDMSHDRIVAIAGCWKLEDDVHYVEVLALDRTTDAQGAVEWLVKNAGRRIPVVVDSIGPAAELIPVLKARKVQVHPSYAPDMGKACGGFYEDVLADRLLHADQPQVNAALLGASKRPIRDAGAWGWNRKNPEVNIAPLVAVTLARFGAVAYAKRRSTTSRKALVLH
jgi:hypothetical protein